MKIYWFPVGVMLLGGCATPGQIVNLEAEIASLKAGQAVQKQKTEDRLDLHDSQFTSLRDDLTTWVGILNPRIDALEDENSKKQTKKK